jgi:serine/threonine protein kinase
MKLILLLSTLFITALSWSDDDKQKILIEINEKKEQKEDDENTIISDDEIDIISDALDYAYFGGRFSNFDEVLGIGTEGVVLKVDFQLLPDHPQTIPVALKINYDNLSINEANSIENYLNLMVNADDQNRIAKGNDLVVYDLSKHYRKMLNKDGSFKNDTPYVSMIYEGAIIMLKDEEDNSAPPKYVTVSVTQLGFSNLLGDFLPRPESLQIQNSNSENVARMIVQTSYALWRMNEQNYIHTDLGEENVLVAGNRQNFSPLIIDFGRLIKLTEFKAKALVLTEEMLNKSDAKYQENLKYVDGSNYLITNQEAAFDFKYITIDPESFLTSEWQEKLSRPHEMYLVNLKYNMGTMQLVTMFDLL